MLSNRKPGISIDSGIGGIGAYNPHLETLAAPKTIESRDGNSIDYWHQYALELENQVKSLVNERDEARLIALERKAYNVGHKAVLKHLIHVVTKYIPKHQISLKKNRSDLYINHVNAELNSMHKRHNLKPWVCRRPEERDFE